MKLYITVNTASDSNPDSPGPVWTTSQGDASKAKTAMIAKLKELDVSHKSVEFKAVEVPTKREELLAFLNVLTSSGALSAAAFMKLTG